MTYRLHNRLGSGGVVIEATLELAGADFIYEPIASTPNQPLGERIGHLTRRGQVPVLELPSGGTMTEVAAILAHLFYAEEGCRNGPHLWIEDHPSFLRWSVFLAVNVYEGILRQSYTERYVTAPLTEDADVRRPAGDVQVGDISSIYRAVKRAADDRVHAAFKCLERETEGHKFLLGDRLSSCDVLLAMLYAWHKKRPDLAKCTWITERVATHQSIRPIWSRNFHDRLDYKWHEL